MINSLQVKLSDIRERRQIQDWTSNNAIVDKEPGDSYYGDEKGQKDALLQEFEASQKLKGFSQEVKPDTVKPLIYDEGGNLIERGNKPEFTQENVSFIKGNFSGGSSVNDTLASLGDLLSKEDIQKSMKLEPKDIKGKTATIGTFNIEWLGTKERSDKDYKEIAQVIKDTDAQVLGIEEISDEKGLKNVMKYLPDYGYILGKAGGQRVGVIFDKKRVTYDVNSIDQIDEAQVGAKLRAPLLVDMKLDNGFDFTFVVVHLKARFDDRAVAIRKKQAGEIQKWVQNHLKESKDKDLIMVGDFNDYAGSDSLEPLTKGNQLSFVTEDLPKDFYSNIPYKCVIDHGVVTNVDKGAMDELVKGSVHTIDESKYPDYIGSVSDHKPVLFVVRSDVDND